MATQICVKSSCGRILKPGDNVKLGKNGTAKIRGGMIGKVINRRNKKTGFTTHFANVLGSIWVKYGKRKDGSEKIVQLMPDLLQYVLQMKKKRIKVDMEKEIGDMDFSFLDDEFGIGELT